MGQRDGGELSDFAAREPMDANIQEAPDGQPQQDENGELRGVQAH